MPHAACSMMYCFSTIKEWHIYSLIPSIQGDNISYIFLKATLQFLCLAGLHLRNTKGCTLFGRYIPMKLYLCQYVFFFQLAQVPSKFLLSGFHSYCHYFAMPQCILVGRVMLHLELQSAPEHFKTFPYFLQIKMLEGFMLRPFLRNVAHVLHGTVVHL